MLQALRVAIELMILGYMTSDLVSLSKGSGMVCGDLASPSLVAQRTWPCAVVPSAPPLQQRLAPG